VLEVDSDRSTVPVYPPEGVTVTVVDPEPPEPELDDEPIVTVTVPVELANVEFPEYVALMTCDPDVVEEKVYVADPPESARDDVSVVPSTVTVRVPVGIVVTELDSEATVMVITSLAPEEGVLLSAVREVVVASREEAELDGHAVSRL